METMMSQQKMSTHKTSSKSCEVKLERIQPNTSNMRRGPLTPTSSPRQSKKLRTASTSTDDKKPLVGKIPAIRFGDLKASTEHVVNSATLRVNGHNNNISKMKMSLGPKSDLELADDSSFIPNSVQLNSSELLEASKALGTNDGKISTSVYREPGSQGSLGCPLPPQKPVTPLTPKELLPATASLYINTPEEAFSPHLLDLCLKHPIVLVRNLAPACGLDLKLYTTKTLVDMHPHHPVEIRNQIEQDADENLDPTMTTPVWYCTSSRGHTTIAKYADYQAISMAEAWNGNDIKHSINPVIKFADGTSRRWIKFGTNCDLSDEKKWGPQLKELMKLPAWARVVSPSNMLSHMGHQILGMNTVQLYMKIPCARTPGHQENNNFCAVNINIGPGDSEWFGVPNEYWGALQRLCKKNNVDYLHGSWWANMKELAEAGIPTYRFMQKPGDLVWVNAGCVHWVQAAGWCNNIAWNIGPLTHRQYILAIERYEWNKTQRFQSIVAMVLLSWNLARNIQTVDVKLFNAIRNTLAESIRQTVQTLNFVRSKGVVVKFHGRRKNDPAHYCGMCEEEVFNTILIRENETTHVVHCLACARKSNPDMSGWICLEEYELDELCKVYDDFKLDVKKESLLPMLKVEKTEEE